MCIWQQDHHLCWGVADTLHAAACALTTTSHNADVLKKTKCHKRARHNTVAAAFWAMLPDQIIWRWRQEAMCADTHHKKP
jgi:hypothetical protein